MNPYGSTLAKILLPSICKPYKVLFFNKELLNYLNYFSLN